ncbi:IS701 family transposase [Actinomadura fibrosa]|uniref:IS701 family transposase n=1 Tax=Actinomadura fibrosa TaxID=111802 RepID=A0ABW2XRN0_9ACTN|nr:transposase [Actinomadura fibrosa]
MQFPESPEFVQRFCDVVLASLTRRDQRKWGSRYVRGLLSTEGRKSMRRIAGDGGSTVEQSLQQFISKSPWDWRPVRRALAEHMSKKISPLVMVVNPLVIPKAGDHSVGVNRQFVAQLGRVANCQTGVGIWLAGSQGSCPIDWHLTLSPRWIGDRRRRERAEIPHEVGGAAQWEVIAEAVAEIRDEWDVRRVPVLVREPCAEMIHALSRRGISFIASVDESFRVIAGGPPGQGQRQETTVRLLTTRGDRRWRPVSTFDHRTSTTRASLGVAHAVRLPNAEPGREHGVPPGAPMVLFGLYDRTTGSDRQFWLSNVTDQPLDVLLHRARLTQRVDMDEEEICRKVGMMDFEGRIYRGWHHHATLVSVAHAIRLISRMAEVDVDDFRTKRWLRHPPLTVCRNEAETEGTVFD